MTFIVATVVGVFVGMWLLRRLLEEHERERARGNAW